ncbi:MAG: hypothetical protein AYK23_01920 [Candidatus Proteinoplasmatales archaeon SG8-5]|nr:MAG: hypothetical protein AYK23_01920 [Candidatus Proteinoplasmatales archaeon SG8-5]
MVSEIRLKVAASSIDGKGVAKLDSESFEKLGLKEGAKVTVTYGTKSKDLTARCDAIYQYCTARLMAQDIEYLRVEPGMHVLVKKKGNKKPKESKPPKPTPKKGKKGKRGKKPKGNTASLDSF